MEDSGGGRQAGVAEGLAGRQVISEIETCRAGSACEGYSEDIIQRIKNYIFIEEHDLGEQGIQRFYPSFAMAQSSHYGRRRV